MRRAARRSRRTPVERSSRTRAGATGTRRCLRPAVRGSAPRYAPLTTPGGAPMTDTVDAPAAVKPINHWIAGGRYAGESGRTAPVYNPARGEQSCADDLASAEEVDRAVQAAKQAFPKWRATSLAKRAELSFAIPELFHPPPQPRRALLRDPRALPRPSRGDGHVPDRRAREGALRRDGRGDARPRGDR